MEAPFTEGGIPGKGGAGTIVRGFPETKSGAPVTEISGLVTIISPLITKISGLKKIISPLITKISRLIMI
jgi:hypothetical protein